MVLPVLQPLSERKEVFVSTVEKTSKTAADGVSDDDMNAKVDRILAAFYTTAGAVELSQPVDYNAALWDASGANSTHLIAAENNRVYGTALAAEQSDSGSASRAATVDTLEAYDGDGLPSSAAAGIATASSQSDPLESTMLVGVEGAPIHAAPEAECGRQSVLCGVKRPREDDGEYADPSDEVDLPLG
jgi:hypothetical protein